MGYEEEQEQESPMYARLKAAAAAKRKSELKFRIGTLQSSIIVTEIQLAAFKTELGIATSEYGAL